MKMFIVRSVIGTCIFALLLTEVTSWTIDLPIAREFFFERSQHKYGDSNKIYFDRRPGAYLYDNIVGDSPHNTHHDHENYAKEYGYLSYREKQVLHIFDKGNVYLEGLRRAMERYSEQLQNCTRLERSRPPTNRTWVPETSSPRNLSLQEAQITACAKVTRDSEHVRRLASLVVWVIKELQDISFAKDYDKKTKESEEYVLLAQLAWALDELAHITGFEPDVHEMAFDPTPAPAPTTTPMTYFNLPIPNDGPTMANCVKQKSPVPATVRCAVPVPAVVLQFLNMTQNNSASSRINNAQVQDYMSRAISLFNNSRSGNNQRPFDNMSMEEIRQQMLGCMSGAGDPAACGGFASFMQFLNNNGQFQNFEPRQSRGADPSQLEILQETEQNLVLPLKKTRSKRSPNDPLREFAMYYGKYKAWTNSNPPAAGGKSDSYDVNNDLTAVKTVRKRSVGKPGLKIRVPEDPMQDLGSSAKHQANVHYVQDMTQANEIKSYLEKIYQKDIEAAKDHVRKLEPLIKSVHKRSAYYQKLHRPRVPEDPMQDISYYVKSRPGTNIRPNPANAALVRLGLQQIFETGNINVVHRYGSNYIPGVRPLMLGALESFTDI